MMNSRAHASHLRVDVALSDTRFNRQPIFGDHRCTSHRRYVTAYESCPANLIISALRSLGRTTFHCFVFLLLALLVPVAQMTAHAYDNSVFPLFEMDKVGRAYNWVSIHPDGERWLISECLKSKESRPLNCQLFIYNLRTKQYQRYALPFDYSYTYAQFSPSGHSIVAARNPIKDSDNYQEKISGLTESDIVTMKIDGTGMQVHPVAAGHIKMPSLSLDETRVAYWQASAVRPPGSKTVFAGYDVHELDLQTGKHELFAGQFNFFLASRLHYRNKNQVLVSAYGPSMYAARYSDYRAKFNSSEIYFIDRGVSTLPPPSFTDIEHAADVTFDGMQTIYLLGTHAKHGISILRPEVEPAHWRIPPIVPSGISALIASPDGRYIAFIYAVNAARSREPGNGLGIFDLALERWIPLSLPASGSAETLSVEKR